MILNPVAKPSTLNRGRAIPIAQALTAPPETTMAADDLTSRLTEPIAPVKAPLWAWSVATVCGVGHLRPGPGTWGSLTAVLLWWSLGRLAPLSAQPWLAAAIALAVTIIGIPAATLVARGAGRKDPQQVVIDEVAGQMIALIGVPLYWKPLLVGFILFRAFDMVKPPPVRQLERLPEGTGIVVDDIGAGIYALIVMLFISWKFGW